jgi:hypothetical protein
MVQADWDVFRGAALLLALLLARADPGLRAAFLNGPEASLLVTSLVNWGCYGHREGIWEPKPDMTRLPSPSFAAMVESLLSLCRSAESDVKVERVPAASGAMLMLALFYLQPASERQQPPATPTAPYVLVLDGSAGG